jgi:hypothetical protein
MTKKDPTKALRKHLQKIEKSHARLSALTARIAAQGETISDLIALAHAFVVENLPGAPAATTAEKARPARRTPAARSRSAGSVKRSATKPAAARAAKRTTAKPAAAATAKRATPKRTAGKRTTTAAKPAARRKPAAAPPSAASAT